MHSFQEESSKLNKRQIRMVLEKCVRQSYQETLDIPLSPRLRELLLRLDENQTLKSAEFLTKAVP